MRERLLWTAWMSSTSNASRRRGLIHPAHSTAATGFLKTGDDEKETISSSFERRHPILLPVPERPG